MLFTPAKLGPITLRNRTIRSAAFEGMCPGNKPSEQLSNYHVSVAKGGIGMTTLAYAAVSQSGLSFPHQLWLREEAVPALEIITTAIKKEGAAAAIQIGHCGNMSKRSVAGQLPMSASYGFNIYSPTFVRKMRQDEIREVANDFGKAVQLARQAGFDAVEIHAGHGYLLSQFLSKFTNHRRDAYGGSLENRMRFMCLAVEKALEAAQNEIAVIVKMNMHDGFRLFGGMQTDECLLVAQKLASLGVDGLVLSAGFVSHAPMHVMRGSMPTRTMAYYMEPSIIKPLARYFGKILVPTVPFQEAFFLEEALKFREAVKIPLVYVGGLTSREMIDKVLDARFEFVAMARALIHEPAFVSRMKTEENARSRCEHSNYCIARMYSVDMQCYRSIKEELPTCILKELEKTKRH